MQRRALGAGGFADGNGSEEIGLAFDGGGARALRQIRDRGDAAEVVGERHDGAAMEDVGNRRKLVTNGQLGLDAFGRDVREFDAEEIGERCLHFDGAAHDGVLANSWRRTICRKTGLRFFRRILINRAGHSRQTMSAIECATRQIFYAEAVRNRKSAQSVKVGGGRPASIKLECVIAATVVANAAGAMARSCGIAFLRTRSVSALRV